MSDSILAYIVFVGPFLVLPFLPGFRLRLLQKSVLALCGVTIAFFAIEVALRMGAFSGDRGWCPQREYDDLLDIERRASEEDRPHPYRFRDTTVDPRKPSGEYRLLVFGDSFVWGDGVRREEDRWTRIFERRLRDRDSSIRVLHWGRPGWSTQTQARFLRDNGALWKPDLIIIAFVTNDLAMDGDWPPYRVYGDDPKHDSFYVVRELFPNLSNFVASRLRTDWSAWEKSLYTEERLAKYESVIAELHDAIEAIGAESLIVFTPRDGSEIEASRIRLVEPRFRARGFRTLDLSPAARRLQRLENVTDEDRFAHRCDQHPGPMFREMFAAETTRGITEFLPKSEGVDGSGSR